ncbi:protein-L-isoaspartate O-methyltransferase [Actinomadura geliboluensis]|uniref:protein-L-isoaspartate O-methyltransferase family protein n=1 Tax=Actinomadura geliboluensis TaxID=882440 RepID=UPI0037245FAE
MSALHRFGAGVNRADFIPERIWIRPEGEQLRPLDRADDPELWAKHVAAEESVVTQVSQDANGMLWPTSSSSALHTMRQMIDAAELVPDLNVLEIGTGTGTGYNAAVMADLGVRVTTVEIHPELAATASAALKRTGFADRVTVVNRDGEQGAPERAPFDRVIATAARTIPYTWVEQTRDGGRLVVPLLGPRMRGGAPRAGHHGRDGDWTRDRRRLLHAAAGPEAAAIGPPSRAHTSRTSQTPYHRHPDRPERHLGRHRVRVTSPLAS